jgi:hypothetical protein
MRLGSFAFALTLLGLTSTLLVGCPSNACFLKICDINNNCRCSISSCGEGAAFDTRLNRCRCVLGYFAVAGQCLTQTDANQYCGLGHHWENGGCNPDRCRPGDELDLSIGMCIAHEKVNQVGANMGVQVGEGQKLGCPEGQKLIIDGSTAACVPLSQTCSRDETWTGKACVKVAPCPTGATWDTARAQCVQYAQGSSGDGLAVNVNEWATANYGPNGGPGTPGFCGSFAKKPWSFGLVEGSSAMLRVSVMLSFPEGQIAKGVVQTTTVFNASGNPVPAKGAAEVDRSAKSVVASLVAGGGRASAGTAATAVLCSVVNAAKPQPIPATGGI